MDTLTRVLSGEGITKRPDGGCDISPAVLRDLCGVISSITEQNERATDSAKHYQAAALEHEATCGPRAVERSSGRRVEELNEETKRLKLRLKDATLSRADLQRQVRSRVERIR